MAGLFEEMRVRVEGHARARVAEDAADLHDIEANVEDEMACEGVAQIVEAHPPIVAVETGVDRGPPQHAPRDILVQERGPVRAGEDVVGRGGETGLAAVLAQEAAALRSRGMSRADAAVFGATRCAGTLSRLRAS